MTQKPTEDAETEASTPTPDTPSKRIDPILDLFNALQFSRDRKVMQKPTANANSTGIVQNTQSFGQIPAKFWFVLLIGLSLTGVIWTSYKILNRSKDMANTTPTDSSSQNATAGQPMNSNPGHATGAHTPNTPAPSMPTSLTSVKANTPTRVSAKPASSLNKSIPTRITPPQANSQDPRDKEMEAEREREREREREKEREREREREKERERDERKDLNIPIPAPAPVSAEPNMNPPNMGGDPSTNPQGAYPPPSQPSQMDQQIPQNGEPPLGQPSQLNQPSQPESPPQ